MFPHHENEAAQTRAARGKELARIWMHNGMIQSTGEKMAKSVGNIAPLHEVIGQYGRDAVVMYLISGHYRQPLAFSGSELEEAERRVYRIRDALRRVARGAESPPEMARYQRGVLRCAGRRLQHSEGAGVAVRVGARGQPPHEPAGDADLSEMLGVLGLGIYSLEAAGDVAGIDPEAVELLAQREAARSRAGLRGRRPSARGVERARWEISDGPGGSS